MARTEMTVAQGFNFSTGITIVKSVEYQKGQPARSLKFVEKPEYLLIDIQDVFYSKEPFETPFLIDVLGDKGTLTISSKQKKGWFGFSSREEFIRNLTVKIDRKRLKQDQVIYVYNNDTGDVLGHYTIRLK
ncbi:hypothetical protein KI811_15160 [Geobacter hydrogenophilus]|uniref:hypothetical protein n=1 Tax=Geobacter hydrogenophilus TaxID=40983 RepID=UPI0024904900|nr:hypothetical protein [Geobacter hydrogenophilus]MBT0895149.1 hypothetical protein [Geobacter hydrogenophilus]